MPMSILDFFPFPELRGLQEEVLLTIEAEYENYDVFVVSAPTSSGKLSMAFTIASYFGNSVILNPNNLLVDQYIDKLSAPGIKGYETYNCHQYPEYGCNQRGASCTNCPLRQAKRNLNAPMYVTNFHMYAARLKQNRWHNARDLIVVDEAHNLVKFQQDWNQMRVWEHKWSDMKFGPLISGERREYVQEIGEDFWGGGGEINGHKYTRGNPEALACRFLKPVDVSRMGDSLWPSRTKKIVLLSATISRKDIDALGLGRKRVRYLECSHPIHPSRRPVFLDYISDINSSNLESSTKLIAEHIMRNLLPHHVGQKGMIHATYRQAEILRKYLRSDRIIYHDVSNKTAKYNEFMDSSPEEGKVLVASGMYEGIDLPEELGRWQVVAKIPWPSLGSEINKIVVKRDPELYEWQCLRDVIQAAGRICRTENDFGVTYICDGTMDRLLSTDLVPEWFREAIVDYTE